MEYNIFHLSRSVQAANLEVFELSKALRGSLPFNKLKIWFIHLGDCVDLERYHFSKEDAMNQFMLEFGSYEVPEVACLHLTGYKDEKVAAEMCYNIIGNCAGERVILVDTNTDASGIIPIVDSLESIIGGGAIREFAFLPGCGLDDTVINRIKAALGLEG